MNISHVLYDGICVGLFHASEQTHCAPVVHDPFGNERLLLLYTPCFEEPLKWLQCCLVVTWLVPHETAAVSAQVLCTPYNHAPDYSVILFADTCQVHLCLAVTYHLYFWQNDWGYVCATAVTQARNGYRNKSQHIKLTLEKAFFPATPAGS